MEALKKAGITGFNEGHVLPLLTGLSKTVDAYYAAHPVACADPNMMLSKLPAADIKAAVDDAIRQTIEFMHPGEEVWFDKTPGLPMLNVVPDIARLWPEGRFVSMRRRHIENILSRLRKFPALTFELHCQQWVDTARAWQRVKESISPGSFIEIEQYEIARNPAETAGAISRFLSLSDTQCKAIAARFASKNRPQFTGGDEWNIKGLDDVGWSEQQKEIFRKHCSAVGRELGYSEDASYYLR
jgi:hypothetical protein